MLISFFIYSLFFRNELAQLVTSSCRGGSFSCIGDHIGCNFEQSHLLLIILISIKILLCILHKIQRRQSGTLNHQITSPVSYRNHSATYITIIVSMFLKMDMLHVKINLRPKLLLTSFIWSFILSLCLVSQIKLNELILWPKSNLPLIQIYLFLRTWQQIHQFWSPAF